MTYPSSESEIYSGHQDHASYQPIVGSNTRNGERSQRIRVNDALLCSNASEIPTHLECGIPSETLGVAEVARFGHQVQTLPYQENIIPSFNIFQNNFNHMLQMRPEQMADALGSQRFLLNEANPYNVLDQYEGLITPERGMINQNAFNLNNLMTIQNNLEPHALNGASRNTRAVEEELLRRQYMMNPYNHLP